PRVRRGRESDALGCSSYFACSTTCLSPDAVLAAIGPVVAAGACVPTGIPPFDAGLVQVQILPADKAVPCGAPPGNAWPVQLRRAALPRSRPRSRLARACPSEYPQPPDA